MQPNHARHSLPGTLGADPPNSGHLGLARSDSCTHPLVKRVESLGWHIAAVMSPISSRRSGWRLTSPDRKCHVQCVTNDEVLFALAQEAQRQADVPGQASALVCFAGKNCRNRQRVERWARASDPERPAWFDDIASPQPVRLHRAWWAKAAACGGLPSPGDVLLSQRVLAELAREDSTRLRRLLPDASAAAVTRRL
jgi:hypothetical protein